VTSQQPKCLIATSRHRQMHFLPRWQKAPHQRAHRPVWIPQALWVLYRRGSLMCLVRCASVGGCSREGPCL